MSDHNGLYTGDEEREFIMEKYGNPKGAETMNDNEDTSDFSPMEVRANAFIEQHAAYFGMVVAVFLATPEHDRVSRDLLGGVVLHLSCSLEIDAYEFATGAAALIAMAGLEAPHDLNERIEKLR